MANESIPPEAPSVEPATVAPEVSQTPIEVSQPSTPGPASTDVKEAAKSEASAHETSLLSEFLEKPSEQKSEGEKTAELPKVEKEEGEKPPQEAQKDIEPIAYTDFSIPEGIEIKKEQLSEYTKLVGEHRLPQETAQKLIDMHSSAMKNIADDISKNQWDVFNSTQKEWKSQVMADPEIGGAGHLTALAHIASARDTYVPENDRSAFNEFLNVTGAGNHPAFLRMMYRISKDMKSPEPPKSQVSPVQDRGSKPATKTAVLYNHPTSKDM